MEVFDQGGDGYLRQLAMNSVFTQAYCASGRDRDVSEADVRAGFTMAWAQIDKLKVERRIAPG